MDQVKDFVRSASSSLETLELWTVDSGESLIKTVSGDNDQDSMDFPNLVELSLSLPCAADIGLFSRSKLPKLLKLSGVLGSQSQIHRFYSNAPLLAEAEAEEKRRKQKGKRNQRI